MDQLLHSSGAKPTKLVVAPAARGLRPRRRTATRSASSRSAKNRSTTPTSPSTSPRTAPARCRGRCRRGSPRCRPSPPTAPRAARARARRRPSTWCRRSTSTAAGPWLGVAMLKGRTGWKRRGSRPSPVVGQFPKVPKSARRRRSIHTPTAADVGGDLAKIDTRVPPDQMHKVDFADVARQEADRARLRHPRPLPEPRLRPGRRRRPAGRRRVRTARPTSSTRRSTTTTTPARAVRPQLTAFGLRNRALDLPDRPQGVINDRLEGAYGVAELEEAMQTIVPG